MCTRCVHFLNLEPNSVRADVWYNHLCKASPLPTKVDPFDGKTKPFDTNDFGDVCFSEDEFRNCRDVNNGKCPKFKS